GGEGLPGVRRARGGRAARARDERRGRDARHQPGPVRRPGRARPARAEHPRRLLRARPRPGTSRHPRRVPPDLRPRGVVRMSASADAPARLGSPHVEEVSVGVYAYIQPDGTWWINNTGFLVGATRVAAVDACSTEARTRGLLAAIGATAGGRPVRTLVNTHHHGDHTHGNYLFGDATIIAHERCRAEILAEGPPGTSRLVNSGTWTDVEWGEIQTAPPFLTYTDRVSLYVDELKCEVIHAGTPAHSTNDSIVWIPERRVLFAGDLLFNG